MFIVVVVGFLLFVVLWFCCSVGGVLFGVSLKVFWSCFSFCFVFLVFCLVIVLVVFVVVSFSRRVLFLLVGIGGGGGGVMMFRVELVEFWLDFFCIVIDDVCLLQLGGWDGVDLLWFSLSLWRLFVFVVVLIWGNYLVLVVLEVGVLDVLVCMLCICCLRCCFFWCKVWICVWFFFSCFFREEIFCFVL